MEPAFGVEAYREGALARFLAAEPLLAVGRNEASALPGSYATVLSAWQLQDIADYRAALRQWFNQLRVGGHLVVVVPHAFLFNRQTMLPARRRPSQKRLYTARSLMEEVEEALEPNTYRVRLLADQDDGYDYGLPTSVAPSGRHDIVLVLEKIVPPSWELSDAAVPTAGPDYAFQPERTRIERAITAQPTRILILKLDHIGDFIMGIPALEKLRAAFPDAEITLVVGSWNAEIARSGSFADQVQVFDAFPANSSEEEVDVRGKRALFAAMATESYDLAIDLRTDPDTRFLLKDVKASVRAGLGSRIAFPFLDIFAPFDQSRHGGEAAWQERFLPHHFQSQSSCRRTPFQIECDGKQARRGEGALLWGPYRALPAGDYIFKPSIEFDQTRRRLFTAATALKYDVVLNRETTRRGIATEPGELDMAFTNTVDGAEFEFRLWPAGGKAIPDFRFFGGLLMKAGAENVLHQSEYLLLLVELVAIRLRDRGLLRECAP